MKKVVVVEDGELFRKVMVEIFTDAGYEVMAFESGEEAVMSFACPNSESVDFLFTDFNMKALNGVEVLEFARKKFPLANLFLISTGITEEVRNKLKELDATFLAKPLPTPYVLLEEIKKCE